MREAAFRRYEPLCDRCGLGRSFLMKVDGGADAAERPAVPFAVLDHAVSIAVHASLVLFAMLQLCFSRAIRPSRPLPFAIVGRKPRPRRLTTRIFRLQ